MKINPLKDNFVIPNINPGKPRHHGPDSKKPIPPVPKPQPKNERESFFVNVFNGLNLK